MASAELQIVIDLLKANPPIQGSNVAEMRAAMDAMSAEALIERLGKATADRHLVPLA